MPSQPSFEETLADYRQAIDQQLGKFFDVATQELGLDNLSLSSKRALAKLADFTSRPGKRVRGMLAAWAYDQVTGQRLSPNGLKLATSIELVQNYLLIVDDVMDRSDLRRGKPTLHKLFLKERVLEGDEHWAGMLAINVGLLALHLSAWYLGEIPEKPDRVAQASATMQRNISSTVFGQVDDLYQHINRAVSQNDILRAYYLKSSSYTFVNPLQLGLILGGAGQPDVLKKIDEFGSAAGIAFQLRDDMIGVFGDPKLTGKSNLDDIKEGKYTLMMHYAIHHGSSAEAAQLKKYLGNPEFSEADLEQAQLLLESTGAKKFVSERIKFYAKQAKASVDQNPIWNAEAKQFLNQLIDFISERDK